MKLKVTAACFCCPSWTNCRSEEGRLQAIYWVTKQFANSKCNVQILLCFTCGHFAATSGNKLSFYLNPSLPSFAYTPSNCAPLFWLFLAAPPTFFFVDVCSTFPLLLPCFGVLIYVLYRHWARTRFILRTEETLTFTLKVVLVFLSAIGTSCYRLQETSSSTQICLQPENEYCHNWQHVLVN